MSAETTIGWCDSTFNAWIGCTEVSPACGPCYAREWAKRYYPAAQWGGFPRVRTSAATWRQPLAWNRKAERDCARPFVFTNSLADVFDNQVDPQWRRDLFDLMRETPHLVWLALTKRAGNIERMCADAGGLPANCALGGTFANQDENDRDAPKLRRAKQATGALFSFASIEPMLSPVALDDDAPDWIIIGGMGGPSWRAHDVPEDWVRPIRDFCVATQRPFYFKQWSALRPKGRGCDLDGAQWKQRPHVAPLRQPPHDLLGEAA